MIQTTLELIERLIDKTKTFGICWACTSRFACREIAASAIDDEKEEFAHGCVDFKEEEFLDSYNL